MGTFTSSGVGNVPWFSFSGRKFRGHFSRDTEFQRQPAMASIHEKYQLSVLRSPSALFTQTFPGQAEPKKTLPPPHRTGWETRLGEVPVGLNPVETRLGSRPNSKMTSWSTGKGSVRFSPVNSSNSMRDQHLRGSPTYTGLASSCWSLARERQPPPSLGLEEATVRSTTESGRSRNRNASGGTPRFAFHPQGRDVAGPPTIRPSANRASPPTSPVHARVHANGRSIAMAGTRWTALPPGLSIPPGLVDDRDAPRWIRQVSGDGVDGQRAPVQASLASSAMRFRSTSERPTRAERGGEGIEGPGCLL